MRQASASIAASVAIIIAASNPSPTGAQGTLPAPGFHHLQLNSIDPEKAIAFYTKHFPTTSKTTWNGLPALRSPTDVLVLFDKVAAPPPTSPQTAIWHFGWHAVDSRKSLEVFKTQRDLTIMPLYTSDEGGTVQISSDTWPGTGGVLGLTKAQIAEAKAKGTQPSRVAGFIYLAGPDGAIIEVQGRFPAERFNHVHMFQDEPFCAQLWYRKHLNAPDFAGRTSATPLTEANCKVPRGAARTWPALEREGQFRTPTAAVQFDDVALTWYANQGDVPLAPTRGQLYDHIGLRVSDLNAWVAKLGSEGVRFLEQPYRLGDIRAVMIEGPSREAIELVEIK